MILKSAIDAGLQQGIAKSLNKAVPSIVDRCLTALWENVRYPVLAGAQVRFIQAGLPPAEAWKMAVRTLEAFLRSEKIDFGNPAYDWSPDAGRVIAEEMEIEHWDSPE